LMYKKIVPAKLGTALLIAIATLAIYAVVFKPI
jgi:hypothetical protein